MEPENKTNGVDSAAGLAAELNDSHPEPTREAVDAAKAKDAAAAKWVDSSGMQFNPDIHVLKPSTGEPAKNKDGTFRRKPGRKPGRPKGTQPAGGMTGAPVDEGFGARASAEVTVDTVALLGQMIGGAEWGMVQQYDNAGNLVFDEREAGVDAFHRYYEATGVRDIPPGVAVSLWVLMYTGRRFASSAPTRNKAKAAWYWLKSKFSRKKQNGARSDSGSNGIRQNDPGQAAVS